MKQSLPEKLTSLQSVKKLPSFYEGWYLITVFTRASYRVLS
jgi:hypothetical protein